MNYKLCRIYLAVIFCIKATSFFSESSFQIMSLPPTRSLFCLPSFFYHHLSTCDSGISRSRLKRFTPIGHIQLFTKLYYFTKLWIVFYTYLRFFLHCICRYQVGSILSLILQVHCLIIRMIFFSMDTRVSRMQGDSIFSFYIQLEQLLHENYPITGEAMHNKSI